MCIRDSIKAVQKQFKHYHAADTRFISDLKDAVISYAAQQDSLDYEQLVLSLIHIFPAIFGANLSAYFLSFICAIASSGV